jgi:hypothetical protein
LCRAHGPAGPAKFCKAREPDGWQCSHE